jgi:hypothetical protein
MNVEMVFNELSSVNLANNKFEARDLMSKLVMTLQAATKIGVSRSLTTQKEINSLELAPEYYIVNWRNDQDVDVVLRRIFRSLNYRSLDGVDTISDIQSQFNLVDVYFNGQKSEGLRFAAITQSIAISLASSPEWDKSTLLLDLEEIEPDCEIVSIKIKIKHASSKQHIEKITPWIREQISSDIEDGRQLWLDRSKLFDRIDFCDCVEKQLIDILAGDPKLIHIVNIFSTLNQKCQSWDVGSLSLEGLNVSGESESTMNNSNFRKKRIFRCPDGQERVFDPHIKLKFCNWRIHFLAETPGRVIIGYVGTHLPTTKYPT